jgi:diguanylate cyclase (GGDEF)-like protein
MKTSTLFNSQIESRVAIPLIFAIAIPILAVAFFALGLIRHETISSAEDRMQRAAKDYSLLVLERIGSQFRDELAAFYAQDVYQTDRPVLELDADGQLKLTAGGASRSITLDSVITDIDEIEDVRRCVSAQNNNPCYVDPEREIARSWNLRLVAQYDSDIIITTTVSQSRQSVLNSIESITSILPYAIALIAFLVGYGVMLYLRRKFKPIPKLEDAIKNIEQGLFDYRVNIRTGDEFALLGNALNSLSEKLGSSFGFREIASQIDEKILAGSDSRVIFQDICLAAVEFAGAQAAVIVVPENGGDDNIFGIRGGDFYAGRYEHEGTLADEVPALSGLRDARAFVISSGREPWGWMVIDGCAGDDDRIEELVRKASVAATSHNRSSKLYDQATYDGLTGLYNRVAFVHELERMIGQSQRSDHSAALIFLDLDEFKRINDTQGHTVGDQLLCLVAERLKSCVREIDVVARLGGDEFAVGLGGIYEGFDLDSLLNRIVEAINMPMKIGKFVHSMGCSMGVCLIPQDGESTEILLKNADLAMYKAKTVLGSAYVFFNEELNEDTERRVLLEGKLRTALQNNSLEVYLQPKLTIATNSIDSFEALMRWTDADLGDVPAAEFVAVAESSGLIEQLTESVIEQTASVLAAQPVEVIRSIAINLSPSQLSSPGFVSKFLETLHKYDCDVSRIEVEITESVFVSDPQRAKEKLLALRAQGLRISLDDFGSGFSSLNLITQLPLDALKIDKSFVDNIPTNKRSTMVVSKIVEMARELNIEVVAEGVEELRQVQALVDMGCTHVQGYVICRPIPVSELLQFLAEWKPTPRLAIG